VIDTNLDAIWLWHANAAIVQLSINAKEELPG
jgi:hypothetical protein